MYRGAAKGSTPSTAPNPTAPKAFCLVNIQGHIHTHHHSIWDHKYSQQDRCPRVLYAGPHAGQASMGPSPACLHCTNCHIWRVTPRFLPSANLSEEPECLPYCNPCQSSCWESHSSQPGATSDSPNGDPRRVHLWPLERLDPGGIEPQRSRGVAQGETRTDQEAAGQMGIPVSHSNLDLGKMSLIRHQIKLTDQMPFKECYWQIPHMYVDVKDHLWEMLDISAIQKSHSPCPIG